MAMLNKLLTLHKSLEITNALIAVQCHISDTKHGDR